MIDLVSDVLDQQVVDTNGVNAGRVDGIVLELRDGRPPVVAAIEISPITLLERFNRRLGRWYARRDARLGPGRGSPFRVEWSRLGRTALGVAINEDAEATPINALEDWLRVHIVERVPWS